MTQMAGGCACGAVRFIAEVESDEAYLCHCRMCQRAVGSVSVAFVNLPKNAVAWTATLPDLFESSPIARRGFCAACGTSLSFAYPDSDKMDLMVAAFDEPDHFRPRHHFGTESMQRVWLDTGGLPEYRSEAHQPLNDRWIKALGRLPD